MTDALCTGCGLTVCRCRELVAAYRQIEHSRAEQARNDMALAAQYEEAAEASKPSASAYREAAVVAIAFANSFTMGQARATLAALIESRQRITAETSLTPEDAAWSACLSAFDNGCIRNYGEAASYYIRKESGRN